MLIIKKVSRLKVFKESKNILFYLPILGEVNLVQLFILYKDEKKFILPRIKKNHLLDLHYINDLTLISKGKYNLSEPQKSLKKARLEDIDLILVPGIAFDSKGHRIGYGKGYYDRLLQKTNSLKIGIAYDFQSLNKIPSEKHDVTMDYIITEKKHIKMPAKTSIV